MSMAFGGDDASDYDMILYELTKERKQLEVKDRCLKNIRKILDNKYDSTSIKVNLIRKELINIGE